MNPEENPWQTLKGKMIYDNPWIRVDEYDVINPKGGKGIYGKVSFKGLAIGIIPVDEAGNTWLVGQYRYTLSEYSWEIPMGGVPFDEDVEQGALRELREETGLMASSLEYLSKIHTSNSVTDEVGHIYVAKGLTVGKTDFDETEDLSVRKLSFKTALKMVMDGEITDSLSVAGILKYARVLGI
ncbi:MAG: NUDIX hydrolase [Roseivirga sp.]|nr:NUDIX hydrolase [Roseivirga sp.]